MATANPPDGMSMKTGTWATDAVDATDQVYNGTTAVKFPSTGSNTAKLQTDYIPINQSVPLTVEALVRADSVAAGRTVSVTVEFYNSAKVLQTTVTLLSGVLATANTWRMARDVIHVAAYAYMRIVVGKAASSAFNMWFAQFHVGRAARHGKLYLSADASLASSTTPSKISVSASDFDIGSILDTANSRIKPLFTEAGHAAFRSVWVFSGQLEIQNVVDTQVMALQIVKNGTTVIGETYIFTGAAGTPNRFNVTSHPVELTGDDYVELYAAQAAGASKTITGGVQKTWLSGYEISP